MRLGRLRSDSPEVGYNELLRDLKHPGCPVYLIAFLAPQPPWTACAPEGRVVDHDSRLLADAKGTEIGTGG
ncbi:MAG: hypothetical protein ABR529_05970 [Actinomycetota bacterium]